MIPSDRSTPSVVAGSDDDAPISYLRRVREYYQALGYGAPYEWAHRADVPFVRPRRPLSACRVAIVTTASPRCAVRDETGAAMTYNASAKFFAVYSGDAGEAEPSLRIDHVAVDFAHTTGADPGTYFPLAALRRARDAGRIGALAPRFHGVPSRRSQRTTLAVDAAEIVARCRADGADAAILVANCPVCHQTMALVAGALEARGIASVVMGCAKDIVEHVGAARFVFSDFPLGNAAGAPNDQASQDLTLGLALDLLETATAPRTTMRSPLRWSASAAWKLDYCNADRLSPEDIARRRADFDRAKAEVKALREERP